MKTTYTYTIPAGDKWFEEAYADDVTVMDLYDYHLNYFKSLPDSTFETFEESSNDPSVRIGKVVYDGPVPNDTDPKLLEFFNLVFDYYSTDGRTFTAFNE